MYIQRPLDFIDKLCCNSVLGHGAPSLLNLGDDHSAGTIDLRDGKSKVLFTGDRFETGEVSSCNICRAFNEMACN